MDSSGSFLGQGYESPPPLPDLEPVLRVPLQLGAFSRYKDAGEALRRRQDKEREAAGLPPVQRLGARAAAPQRGARALPTGRNVPPSRGRGQITRGAAPSRGGAPSKFNQDKTLYVHLMGNLKKKSLLPVVVFTLSKKRCEENASTLTNLDLCTSTEKSEVHVAIEKALGRLKGMCVLNRVLYGFGICHIGGATAVYQSPIHVTGGLILTWSSNHNPRFGQATTTDQAHKRFVIKGHWGASRRLASNSQRGPLHRLQPKTPTPQLSGMVLTICFRPQIVEILFARGLVKVLFATETFAMVCS